jgi:hypothetical protein
MRTAVHRPAIAKAALAIAILAVAGSVRAEPSTESKWRKACWSDAFSLCTIQSITRNRVGVRDCLIRNFHHISPSCRAIMHDAEAHGISTPDPARSAAPPSNTESNAASE